MGLAVNKHFYERTIKMKKITIKALLLILTLTVLIASAVTVSFAVETSEADDPLRIAGCNLSFENEVFVMYAIKSDDPNVRLLVWEEAQGEYIAGTEKARLTPQSEKLTDNGTQYTVFKYTGLAAKQMTDDIYVRAYIPGEDGNAQYGDVHKYSILQYAYNKLGKTGTASTNPKLIKMLNAMLEYGAAAQEYHNYKLDRLANAQYAQVTLTNGRLPDGFNKGLYKVGSTVTITAPETDEDGAGFVEWVDENGNSVADTATAEITVGENNTTITAYYYSTGLAFTLSSDKTHYIVSGIGTETETERIYIPPTHEGMPVMQIGQSAFEGCTSFKYMIIPDSVKYIIKYAFYNCTGLESVEIPSSVTSIGNGVFFGCSGLQEVHISDISAWCNIDFSSEGPLVYAKKLYLNANLITELIVPDGVTSIGDFAFAGYAELESIEIPSSVTNIGYSAFKDCIGITSVKFGENSLLTSIGACAFAGCIGLTNIIIPSNLTSIGGNAFKDCTGLTQIEIPNSVTSIGSYAFIGCKEVENITVASENTVYHSNGNCLIETESRTLISGCKNSIIPTDGSVTSIWNHTFDSCTGLTNIEIPSSVTNIKYGAFLGCTGLTIVTFGEDSELENIGGSAFSGCTGLTSITIPDSVTTIGNTAFSGCTGITSIVIPDGVTRIGERVFYNCTELTSITIPNSVTSIDYDAFSYCTGLRDVYISDIAAWCSILFSGGSQGNPLYHAKYLYLNGSLITDLIIPEGVTRIHDYAFHNQSSITSVTIPSSVTSIGGYAFKGCTGLQDVHISNITSWCNIALYGWDSNPLQHANNLYLSGSLITDLIIPEGVTRIPDFAFRNQSSITSVTIPSGVTSIGDHAFSGCSGLTDIEIPSSITSIEVSVFEDCTGLREVHISDIAAWCSIIFNNITANPLYYANLYLNELLITELIIPEGVTRIHAYAFCNQSSITSVTIPSSVTSIGYRAFYGCSELTSVIFENTDGWWVSTSSVATSGKNVDVTNTTQNATYLKSTYTYYYWKRS